MSKYKVGDKFIIEIADVLHVVRDKGEYEPPWYECRDIDEFSFSEIDLDRLEVFDSDAKANADYNAGYEDGLRDAWECAKIIANFNAGELYARFGVSFTAEVLDEFSPSEAENIIVEYEAKQAEIKVGDELQNKIGERFVVIGLNDDGESVQVLCYNGKLYLRVFKKHVTKTGRHFPIEDILEQMRGADDD